MQAFPACSDSQQLAGHFLLSALNMERPEDYQTSERIFQRVEKKRLSK